MIPKTSGNTILKDNFDQTDNRSLKVNQLKILLKKQAVTKGNRRRSKVVTLK